MSSAQTKRRLSVLPPEPTPEKERAFQAALMGRDPETLARRGLPIDTPISPPEDAPSDAPAATPLPDPFAGSAAYPTPEDQLDITRPSLSRQPSNVSFQLRIPPDTGNVIDNIHLQTGFSANRIASLLVVVGVKHLTNIFSQHDDPDKGLYEIVRYLQHLHRTQLADMRKAKTGR